LLLVNLGGEMLRQGWSAWTYPVPGLWIRLPGEQGWREAGACFAGQGL